MSKRLLRKRLPRLRRASDAPAVALLETERADFTVLEDRILQLEREQRTTVTRMGQLQQAIDDLAKDGRR